MSNGTRNNSEEGAVLIIVLFLLAALAVTCLDLGRSALLDRAFSHSTRASIAAKPLLIDCENLAANFLVRDYRRSDRKPESEAAANRRLSEWLIPYAQTLKNVEITLTIEDENGRFPLRALFPNAASEKIRAERYATALENILAHLLIEAGYEKGDDQARMAARRYVAQLLAWGGEKPMTNEARQWYLSREPPYLPPRRPPESLAELGLVYWPDMDEDLARKVLLGDVGFPGFADSVSVWSRGPLNIHALTRTVALGFSSDYQRARAFADELLSERAKRGDELPSGWENDVFANGGVIRPPANILSGDSRWRRLKATVRQGAASATLESVGWLDKNRMNWISRDVL